MRVDRSNVDAFALLFKAGKHRPKKKRARGKELPQGPVPSPDLLDHSFDDTIPEGTRLHKTQRERQLEAIKREEREAKRARELQQRRRDRIASEFPSARRFFRTIDKVSTEAEAIGYLDCDVDLAQLARSLSLAEIKDDYDRFSVFEYAVAMVRKLAKGTEHAHPAPDTYFENCVTAISELKQEMRLT